MRKTTPNDKKGYILQLRQSRTFKGVAVTLALSLIFELIQPTAALALTEGPSQPEVQSFEPIGTTQMVDLFTGDFNYNIPLFNLPGPNGGYPVNLAYHAGVSMDDEASWVGLGWNLNVGALVRNMRGLPDEFLSEVHDGIQISGGEITALKGDWKSGDYIRTKTDMKASWTLGANFKKGAELFGGNLIQGGLTASLYYNNYRGLGASVGTELSFGKNGSSPFSLGFSLDSENGLGISPKVSIGELGKEKRGEFNLSLSFDGSVGVSMGASRKGKWGEPESDGNGRTKQKIEKAKDRQASFGSGLSFARSNFSPSIGNNVNSYSLSFNLGAGNSKLPGFFEKNSVGIFYNTQDYSNIDKTGRKRPVMGYAESTSHGDDRDDYFTQDFVRSNDGQVTKETVILAHSYYAQDAYSSTGQGLSGYFRGRRNDVGRVHDPKNRNTNFGASLSLEFEADELTSTEISPPTTSEIEGVFGSADLITLAEIETAVTSMHLGVGGSISFGWDDQRPWDRKNELNFDFHDPYPSGIKENHYYQAHGEQTVFEASDLSYMNGTDLALVTFEPKNTNIFTGGKRTILATDNQHISEARDVADGRVVRNTLIHSLKNKEVEHLGEFIVPHYNFSTSLDLSSSPTTPKLNRTVRNGVDIDNHNAGFKILNEDGSYYVYGLPAYNVKEVENLFSVETPTDPNTTNPDFLYHNQINSLELDTLVNGEVDYKKSGTHKFINKTETSPYAHSYLLTSVQGADYVDVENDGPTDDDLGYWVKFDYVKYDQDIKWRAPYYGANYSQGQTYTGQDDKGAYQYGEKEQWYLGRMETKSHIAIFELSERNDMLEAHSEFANTTDGTGTRSGLKIDKIKIYEKSSFVLGSSNNVPLQTVHFEYDYSLCQGVLNNDGSALINPANNIVTTPPNTGPVNHGGKLTLKRIYFTSLNSSRGELSPYEFDYTSVNIDPNYQSALQDGGGNDLVNPNYQQNAYDSWGGYKPYATWAPSTNGTYDGGYQQHSNFPYVAQTSQGWKQQWSGLYPNQQHETQANKKLTQQANDLIASTWSLREIKLPSGGTIKIEYESDDYSHVQHKVANQMFKIVKVGTIGDPNNTDPNYTLDPNDRLYGNGNEDNFYSNDDSGVDEERRRIYFKLEKPIQTNLTSEQYADSIFDQYVEPITQDEGGKRNLYYKARTRLTFNANGNQVYEYIRGYLPLEDLPVKQTNSGANVYNYGVLNQNVPGLGDGVFTDNDGIQKHGIGFITIKPAQRKNGDDFHQYHPMALAAWTYMQTNAQELLNPASTFNSVSEPSNTGEVLGLLTNVLGAVPATAASFGLIRPYCKNENFAQFIDLANSGIRLASPDRKKFGGGHRVKQISISDNWDADTGTENSRTYGQVYDYTIREDGMTMSSGVAQYEPQAGGDENALKYPIYFYGKNKMFTNNNLFAEAPMNEALFPGAMVGYRQVTVRSLNTSDQMRKHLDTSSEGDGRTGGITEHQFYTSKDFPTRVEWSTLSENNHTKDAFTLPIPLPFIGSLGRNYYHGSQAFKIELNDMHGKPKSVKSYELNGYSRNNAPITESVYEYQSKPIIYQGEKVNELVSEVQVIPQSSGQDLTNTVTRLMGVETDLFTDQRESKSFINSIGLDFNAEIIPIGIIPSFWPSYSNHKTLFRTYVTNKVVHRSGILKKTKTRDLQTINESEVLAYDEKAGVPLVSRVKNEFGDYFYSYNVPAYYHYDRMGHAYRNINYTFGATASVVHTSSQQGKRRTIVDFTPSTPDVIDHLVRGDELLVLDDGSLGSSDYIKGYFLGWTYDALGNKVKAKIQLLEQFFPDGITGKLFKFKVIRSGRRNHYGSMAANYLTKGEMSFHTNQQTLDGTLGNLDFVQTKVIDNVLSATASLFKDDWTTIGGPNTVLDSGGEGQYTENPFLSGNSGIFRPYKSYTYVGDREGNADMADNTNTSGNPELYNDGIMNNVQMFTWDLGNIEDYVQNWEWVNEVTRFSTDAYEIENVNRLGIFSSALYGYDNSLTIGVGGNASSFELGVMDFEINPANDPEKLLSQTNMNFSSSSVDAVLTEQHTINSAFMSSSNVLTIKTKIPSAGFDIANYEGNIGLSLITRKGAAPTNEGYYFNARISNVSNYTDAGVSYIEFTATPFIEGGSVSSMVNLLPPSSNAHGKITLMTIKNGMSSASNATHSTDKAHSGKASLKISAASLFDQPQLKLVKDKKYIVSLWVSKANTKVPTYEPGKFGNSTNKLVKLTSSSAGLTVHSTTYSKIVEGWQKIDFEISSNQNNDMLRIEFLPMGGDLIYVDDVRFSPKTGGITTYVYDPNRFWLRASLNVDNYATFFYYDEEGNLTIKKQETEEGIFTITESRGHVSEKEQ